MHQEVIPWRCKSDDWLLNLSQVHFGLHQGKSGSDHEGQGPQKTYIKA
jgi:hypothetical protein